MNEPLQEVGEERPARAGLRDMGAQLVITILGPNEERALPRFLPYAPRFNLRPPRKGLPIWSLPLIAAIAALLLVVPVSAAVRFLSDQTIAEIEETKRKTEMRLKEDAQYQAALKRLKTVAEEKAAIDKVAGPGPRWSILLDRMREQLPPGVRLTLVQADARGKVSIEGESADIRGLGAFMLFMRAYRDSAGRSFFERPKLFYSERKQRKNPFEPIVYKFQLTLRVPAASLAELGEPEEDLSSGAAAETGSARTSAATVSLPASPLSAIATGLEGNKQMLQEAQKQLLSD
ncbi:MAG: PilN domain-containing protein [Candidatus Sericytochromatia bacterium]|nr:PilN domain-containing protein [Candidatus Tanganyikabacteria bacterium]